MSNFSSFLHYYIYIFITSEDNGSLDLSVSSSSWGLGRAAVSDCGTPWTFLLPLFEDKIIRHPHK